MERSAAKFWWGEELPKGIAYLSKNHLYDDWVPTTYKELLEKKIEKQKWELDRKRDCETTVTLPGYIWIFYVPGSLFAGWWIYIKTRKHDYGISFRHERNDKLIVKCMQLFPLGIIPVLENFDHWAKKFAQQYPHVGFKRNKNQGLVKCRCTIDHYNKLIDIWKIN